MSLRIIAIRPDLRNEGRIVIECQPTDQPTVEQPGFVGVGDPTRIANLTPAQARGLTVHDIIEDIWPTLAVVP